VTRAACASSSTIVAATCSVAWSAATARTNPRARCAVKTAAKSAARSPLPLRSPSIPKPCSVPASCRRTRRRRCRRPSRRRRRQQRRPSLRRPSLRRPSLRRRLRLPPASCAGVWVSGSRSKAPGHLRCVQARTPIPCWVSATVCA
jgi:hypothetical protein